ncbi:MAG TPA: RagB/SusD family nutrient uptake outer membrane protein [Gemmatimonadaceae bacterium]|nr:RagB/SusD family nutrient uptake outer membrane protein [Gemmatimonadaceae bacterium]
MTRARNWAWLATVALLPLGACHGLFDVQSPGKIQDADLNTPVAVPGIVTGMSYDMARALNNSSEALSLLSVELYHGGSYNWGDLPAGIVKPEDVNGTWEAMFRPRYTTTAGIARIKGLISPDAFAKSPEVARAYMLGGFANRHIGENVCQTINPATGVPESNTAEFDRGIANFQQAIQIGTAAGKDAADYVTGAYGGLATLEAWKGNWAAAATDAAKVPADFVITAPLMVDGLSNTLNYETHSRYEYSVWSTEAALHYGDPRVPWDTLYSDNGAIAVGANGATPMFQQRKYDDLGANIPLTKGTEMLVLRAEAALRQSTPDIAGAYALMNEERAQYASLNPLTPSTDINQAWADLHWEREAVTWLEGRHLWDERRWFAETGPAHYDIPKTAGDPTATLADRAICIPISKDELQSNPNIPSQP